VIRRDDAERPSIKPLNLHRLSESFEALREAADRHLAKTGWRPRVFLATMGPVSQHKGRGDFSRGFFEVGGFEVVYPDGFTTVDEAVAAAVESGAKVVTLCSTDDTYPELVKPFVAAVKAEPVVTEDKDPVLEALAGLAATVKGLADSLSTAVKPAVVEPTATEDKGGAGAEVDKSAGGAEPPVEPTPTPKAPRVAWPADLNRAR
jgi:hypothetical protein